MEHISFGSVESLHNKVKEANKRFHAEERFVAKPKLHGTNASIVLTKNTVYAQSRKNVVTLEKDNAGFARFVDGLTIKNENMADHITTTIYGEWAGEGIQNNDAVTLIGKKAFFVFAARTQTEKEDEVFTDPAELSAILNIFGLRDHPDIYVIPVMAELDISFSGSTEHLESVENSVNALVAQFEEVDPYINMTFGVVAPGEGVVVYPKNAVDWDEYKGKMFKAKTSSHRVNKAKKAASAKVVVSPDVLAFTEQFATVPRFEQAMTELGIDFDNRNMGQFLKWVNEDVIKESKDELEASNLEWKQCAKQITNRAREWFMRGGK